MSEVDPLSGHGVTVVLTELSVTLQLPAQTFAYLFVKWVDSTHLEVMDLITNLMSTVLLTSYIMLLGAPL